MPALPERLINFKCYNEAAELLGVTTVDLPQLQAMTDTVKGAGIAGEIDSPTIGHYQAMSMTVNFRTYHGDTGLLADPHAHVLEFRGSIQQTNTGTGLIETVPMRVLTRAKPTSTSLGTGDVSAAMDSSVEFSVDYILVELNGKTRFEYDPLNFICRINDVDVLASVRDDIS